MGRPVLAGRVLRRRSDPKPRSAVACVRVELRVQVDQGNDGAPLVSPAKPFKLDHNRDVRHFHAVESAGPLQRDLDRGGLRAPEW